MFWTLLKGHPWRVEVPGANPPSVINDIDEGSVHSESHRNNLVISPGKYKQGIPLRGLCPPQIEAPHIVLPDCIQFGGLGVVTVVLTDHEPSPVSHIRHPGVIGGVLGEILLVIIYRKWQFLQLRK